MKGAVEEGQKAEWEALRAEGRSVRVSVYNNGGGKALSRGKGGRVCEDRKRVNVRSSFEWVCITV